MHSQSTETPQQQRHDHVSLMLCSMLQDALQHKIAHWMPGEHLHALLDVADDVLEPFRRKVFEDSLEHPTAIPLLAQPDPSSTRRGEFVIYEANRWRGHDLDQLLENVVSVRAA